MVSTVSVTSLAAAIAEVADALVDEFDLIEFLHLVASRAAELVGAAAVGLLLADLNGELQFVAGSQDVATMLERFQLHMDEGPCVEAFRTGQSVTDENLSAASKRWPNFAPAALAAGFTGVHALPMRLRKQVIGGLNLFTAGGQTVSGVDLEVVQAFTHVATVGLLQERAVQEASLLAGQLEKALTSRVVIEQAKGAISQVHGITVDEAFAALRSYARRNHYKLTELASDCVTDPDRFPALMIRRAGSPSTNLNFFRRD
ncbi:MAG: hypothetical protein JWN06_1246 [Propionibacteriaceae bacterium]|nr:hypothetical protein [Propionibacteriaceae bacterium]